MRTQTYEVGACLRSARCTNPIAMPMDHVRIVASSLLALLITGCSSSVLYNGVQGVAYQRCDSIQDASERARCKAANYPDEERYKKERAAASK